MTMMARKCSPIPRLADDYSREAAAKCIDFVGAATGARKKSSQVNILDTRGKRVTAEAAIPAQLVREVMRTTPEQLFRECLELLGCYGAGKVRKLAEIVAATAPCSELSLGSAIVAGEWGGARERLGRNRPALRGFNSEKEASWTG
jgi:hydroxymethylglutaryl-CoA reductase